MINQNQWFGLKRSNFGFRLKILIFQVKIAQFKGKNKMALAINVKRKNNGWLITLFFTQCDDFGTSLVEKLAQISFVEFADGRGVDFEEFFIASAVCCFEPVHQRRIHLQLRVQFVVFHQCDGRLRRVGTLRTLTARFPQIITLRQFQMSV